MNTKDKIILNNIMEFLPYNNSFNYLWDNHLEGKKLKNGTMVFGLFSIENKITRGLFIYEENNIPKNLSAFSILKEWEIDNDYSQDGVTFIKPISQ